MMDERLIGQLEADATLVAATRRLARAAEAAYARAQQERGLLTWATPAIYSYDAWLNRLWCEAEDLGLLRLRLLDGLFERTLWERYIRADTALPDLFDKKFAGSHAQDAYALLRQQGFRLEDLPPLLPAESSAFRRWSRQFEKECAARELLPCAELEWKLAELVGGKQLAFAGPILFGGFDQFTPAQREIQSAMDAAAIPWRAIEPDGAQPGPAHVLALTDPLTELRTAAQWARSHCESHPGDTVGVVVLDLEKRRRLVERVFRDVFTPGPLWQAPAFEERVNISLGQRLLDRPPVQEALWLLELCVGEAPWTRASALLRSPNFGGGGSDDRAAAARRELVFRRRTGTTVDLGLLRDFERDVGAAQKGLSWSAVADAVDQWPALAAPSRWRENFDQLLSGCAWLAGLESTAAIQLRQWFRNVADRLSGLDAWLDKIDAIEAVARFKQLLADEVVQEETPFAPVQILGGLEAGGLEFDVAWIAGARDDALPTPIAPNPFLPAFWQRKEGFPRADPQREYDYARRRIAGLAAIAPRVVFSYGEKDGDQQFGPSPLLRQLPRLDGVPPNTRTLQSWSEHLLASAVLETYSDERGPALQAGVQLGGGAGVIKSQSLCPFQGFARAQLAVEPLSEPAEGFSAAERGTLVHLVLRRVWDELRHQERLRAAEPEILHRLIEDAATAAVERVRKKIKRPLPQQLIRLECLRLVGLVKRWLAIELSRPPFEVEACESERIIEIGPVRLKTQVDRIDRLPDGGRLIFDYKTGLAQVKDWFGARPDDPQLPLYAVTDESFVDGLAFIRLRPGDMRLLGLGGVSDAAPGLELYATSKYRHGDMSWKDQLAEWRNRLEALAGELIEGIARVEPKNGDKTCERCQRMSLCRVYEFAPAQAVAQEEDDDVDSAA